MSTDCSFRASDGSSRLIRGSFVIAGTTLTVLHSTGRAKSVILDAAATTPAFVARAVLAEIDKEERV